METTVAEFDKWYDLEAERLTNKLPDPNTVPFPIISIPVNFSEIKCITIGNAASDTIELHSIRFEKMHDRKEGKYYWKRIK